MLDPIQIESINAVRDLVHKNAVAKGFYDKPEGTIEFITRSVANLHGEASELWEAARKGALTLHCDKAAKMPEPLTCEEEELADLVIRSFDHAGRRSIDIGRAISIKMAFNATREYRHGNKAA